MYTYTHGQREGISFYFSSLPLSLSLSLQKLISALLCQKLVCFQVTPRVLTIVLTTSEAVLNLPRQYEGNLARAKTLAHENDRFLRFAFVRASLEFRKRM